MTREKVWVQHASGQGQKWEVVRHSDDLWESAESFGPNKDWAYLPTTEYKRCDPPVREWDEVTNDVTPSITTAHWWHDGTDLIPLELRNGYRLRKVQLREEINYQGRAAFIMERVRS